ncbi:MAG: DUF962 domain-containing protein [Proteobacteria bacterium]|nr:DUF962 domain-containing protein [Pseudomonadota bacterium]MDA1355156.1 DUF962 domain-containing protein [Pseudomonadota bacterium]
MAKQRITTYREFWPVYVTQHSRATTRLLHFIGTSGGLALIGAAAALPEPWLFLAAPFSGYLFAWIGHFFVERNRPATFSYPLFSLIGDFHMYGLMWLGRMGTQAAQHNSEASE